MTTKVELIIAMVGGVLCKMLNMLTTVFLNLFLSSFFARTNEG